MEPIGLLGDRKTLGFEARDSPDPVSVVLLGDGSTTPVHERRDLKVEVGMLQKREKAAMPWAAGGVPDKRLVAADRLAAHVTHAQLHAGLPS